MRDALVVAEPDLFFEIVTSPEVYAKDFALLTRFGRSRFDANGAEWAARRDLTQPHYLRAAGPTRAGRIEEIFAAALADPAAAQPGAIQKSLFGASLVIFFEALGCEVSPAPFLPIVDRIRAVFRQLQFLAWTGGSQAAVAAAEGVAGETLAAFHAACLVNPHIAALLDRLAAADVAPDFDPVAELAINMFAGVETTTAALSWMIDRLGCNLQVQERVRDEALGGGVAPYLEAMINETLRFFPPIPFMTRRVTRPATLGGVTLPEGQLLIVSIVGLHQHPRSWSDAGVFQSARREFLDGTYDRRSFAPFLAGPRVCGGMKLARLEMRAALAAFLRRYRVERDGDEVRIDYALAMRPALWDALRIVERSAG